MTTISPVARAIAWAAAHPAEMAWLEANVERNEFAASLATRLGERGELTAAQVEALQKAAAEAQKKAAAPEVSVGEIEARFSVARERGVKAPAMRLDEFVFKAASAESRNAGGIYVTTKGDGESTYLGKILGGRFIRTSACTTDQEARIVAAASNPDEAARAYGQRTGNCSICGRELTAEESIERFIGPICYQKFFGG